jgi:hypothetical protein
MNPVPASAPPGARKPEWLERNWKWLVPVAAVVFIGAICVFIALLMALMKTSAAYTGALARARSSPAVVQALGTPLTEGYFIMGNIHLVNSSGYANLTIPVAGPKDAATLYAEATKTQGEWHFDVLVLRIDRTGQRIDLSDRKVPPGTTPAAQNLKKPRA